MMQSGRAVKRMTAQRGAERSWSHHTDLTAEQDEEIKECGEREARRKAKKL